MSWDCDNVCTVNEGRMPNNSSRFLFFLCLRLVLFDLTRMVLLEVCKEGRRNKESTFCKLVTKAPSVFLSGAKNCAKEAMGDQRVSVPQQKGVARTSQ